MQAVVFLFALIERGRERRTEVAPAGATKEPVPRPFASDGEQKSRGRDPHEGTITKTAMQAVVFLFALIETEDLDLPK